MMKHIFSILLLLNVAFSFGQGPASNKKNTDSLTNQKFRLVNEFLNLSPKDVIADIGTGAGYSLIPIANGCGDCKFVVEDIDSLTCNKETLSKKITKTGNKTSIENFSFYYGTEKTTNLPSSTYNKVLIFDVIHEMTYRKEMLNDIKRILQPDGSVFIEEILVNKKVKKDRICNYPFLTEMEFKKLLAENDLLIIKEATTFDSGNNRYIKIFECTFSK